MTFLNNFYDNNYGMMQTFNSIHHARTAENSQKAAAAAAEAAKEQRKLRESQERVEETQLRMEKEAKAAQKKILALEQEKVELEKARHAEDDRQREQVARFRRLTAFSIALTDDIISAMDETS
jgi:hypothetical protein